MKYNNNKLTHVLKRTKNIITNPQKEWMVISEHEETKKELFGNYAFPLIGLCSLVVFAGTLINYYSFSHAITQMLLIFLSLSAGLYISSMIIRILAPSFNASTNENKNFMLVIYAASIFCIFHSAANIFGHFSFFRQLFVLLELYFIRLLWLGITPLLKVPENKKAGFTLISGLLILIIPLIIERMLSILFQVPIVSI